VGATARVVLLSYAHGIPLARATEDADVAFSVPDWAAFAAVPRKDAFDFFAILANSVDAGQSERLYGEAAHLLEVEAFDYLAAGAWLLGHDARTCVEGHSERAERIVATATDTLEREASADGALRLVGEAPQGLNTLTPAFIEPYSAFSKKGDSWPFTARELRSFVGVSGAQNVSIDDTNGYRPIRRPWSSRTASILSAPLGAER
jgi:hypothetical protein